MIKKIHVYDLDGVLVDTSHRYRNLPNGSIDLDYWLANRTKEKIARDTLLPLAAQYQADRNTSAIYTVICTARQSNLLDIDFILSQLGAPDRLLMRPIGNSERDAQLKYKQLTRLFNSSLLTNLPSFFWDDNKINLAACRDLFTDVFHVPSHITGK